MKRLNLAMLCAAVTIGTLALTHAVLAQVQKAPADLATLIQSGKTKLALEQIQAGADVNRVQPDGTDPPRRSHNAILGWRSMNVSPLGLF